MDMNPSLDPHVRIASATLHAVTRSRTPAEGQSESSDPDKAKVPCTPLSRSQNTPPGEVVSIGPIQLDLGRRAIAFNGRAVRLSRLDCSLLLALGKHQNRMLSYSRIIQQVWGRNQSVTTTGLRVRVFHLRNKLDALRIDEIRIRNIDRMGYIMEVNETRDRRSSARREGGAQLLAIAV